MNLQRLALVLTNSRFKRAGPLGCDRMEWRTDRSFDSLTGLLDRKTLRKVLRRSPEKSLVRMGVEGIKSVNTLLSDDCGDQVLQHLAALLRTESPPDTVCFHPFGAEFLLLWPQLYPESETDSIEEFRQVFAEPVPVGHQSVQLTTHWGIVPDCSLSPDATSLLQASSRALMKARSQDGDRLVVESPFSVEGSPEDRSIFMGADLQETLASEEDSSLFPAFQPIVTLQREKLVGLEALARWESPNEGPISPAQFLPTARSQGLIQEVDWTIFRQSLDAWNHWSQKRVPDEALFKLHMNFSPAHFLDPRLASKIQERMKEAQLDASILHMEVVEQVALPDRESARKQLVSVAEEYDVLLDDFGTGYSSMSAVLNAPFHGLKIDQDFVQNLDDSDVFAVLNSMIRLANDLDLSTVAEGVETVEQRRSLRQIGCDYYQGYLEARPMKISEVPDYLENKQFLLAGEA